MSDTITPAQAFEQKMRHEQERGAVWGGLTLRDYFAGQVLASAAALPNGEGDYVFRARVAYAQANAMLAERERAK